MEKIVKMFYHDSRPRSGQRFHESPMVLLFCGMPPSIIVRRVQAIEIFGWLEVIDELSVALHTEKATNAILFFSLSLLKG